MRLLAITGLILALTACGANKKSKEELEKAERDTRFEQVMAIHDEVMPKMSDIRKLKKALQAKADTTDASDSSGAAIEPLSEMIYELEEASESMMVWMRAFSEPDQEMPHDEAMKYYDEEMAKIQEVKNKMLQAIEKAEAMR